MSEDAKDSTVSRRGFLGMGSAALAAAGVLSAADAAGQERSKRQRSWSGQPDARFPKSGFFPASCLRRRQRANVQVPFWTCSQTYARGWMVA